MAKKPVRRKQSTLDRSDLSTRPTTRPQARPEAPRKPGPAGGPAPAMRKDPSIRQTQYINNRASDFQLPPSNVREGGGRKGSGSAKKPTRRGGR
jgi:hypothetical protein